MGMFSGIMKAIAPLALTIITGGAAAPLMAMAMKMVAMEVAKQVIQIVGEKLGLPQGIIDMCKMACASAAGMPDSARTSFGQAASGLASQLNLSPSESGRFERELQGSVNSSAGNMISEIERSMPALKGLVGKKAVAGSDEETGESWLVALAKAMGKVMDDKALKMQGLSNEISAMTSGSNNAKAGTLNGIDGTVMTGKGDNQQAKNSAAMNAESTKISSKSALLQAYGQELGIISNAVTNVLKSVGEANATMARKG